MGGGIGSVAGPIVAGISKEMGALTIAVISSPFRFESKHRKERSVAGIEEMKKAADMTLLIPYDRLQTMLPPGTMIKDAFEMGPKTLCSAVSECCSFMLNNQSFIDGDFQSKKAFLQDVGLSYIGLGTGNNVKESMETAIYCPLLGDDDLRRAGKVIVNIGTIPEITHEEVCDALGMLQHRIDKTTFLAFETMIDSEARVGLIITELR